MIVISNPNIKSTVIANPTFESTVIPNPNFEEPVIAISKLQQLLLQFLNCNSCYFKP